MYFSRRNLCWFWTPLDGQSAIGVVFCIPCKRCGWLLCQTGYFEHFKWKVESAECSVRVQWAEQSQCDTNKASTTDIPYMANVIRGNFRDFSLNLNLFQWIMALSIGNISPQNATVKDLQWIAVFHSKHALWMFSHIW